VLRGQDGAGAARLSRPRALGRRAGGRQSRVLRGISVSAGVWCDENWSVYASRGDALQWVSCESAVRGASTVRQKCNTSTTSQWVA
jgi:hypothetical protein